MHNENNVNSINLGIISIFYRKKLSHLAVGSPFNKMFKKFKDKLAEEVKSSPQRIQQFAQAAQNVLVETQDKALRRISELKEQCSLEQSAKAHLEKALRVELDEKSMKIDALSTQISLIQNKNIHEKDFQNSNENINNQVQLITLNDEHESEENLQSPTATETVVLNNKIEKLEQLLSKYKESLKLSKEKNSQLSTDIQKLALEIESVSKENDKLKSECERVSEDKKLIKELLEKNEVLENTNKALEFSKNKEIAITASSLKIAEQEISSLQKNIEDLKKREEEYAISLAENKLSIHKELEDKEAEIKSLKESVSISQTEHNELNKIINESKNKIVELENERSAMLKDLTEVNSLRTKIHEISLDNNVLLEQIKTFDNNKGRLDEEYKCLELQLKQETAEKLAMIDRNVYLESRNTQLTEENIKKSTHINSLEAQLLELNAKIESIQAHKSDGETAELKIKCNNLESEIQEERVELVKLQTEIEKLLYHHETLQNQNLELNIALDLLKTENDTLQQKLSKMNEMNTCFNECKLKLTEIRKMINIASKDSKSLRDQILSELLPKVREAIIKQNSLIQEELETSKAEFHDRNNTLNVTNSELKFKHDQFIKDMELLEEENKRLKVNLQEKDSDYSKLLEMKNLISAEQEQRIGNLDKNCEKLSEDNKKLLEVVGLSETNINNLKKELNMIQSKNNSNLEQLTILMDEKRQLLEKTIVQDKSIKDILNDLKSSKADYNNLLQSSTEIKNSNLKLEREWNELSNQYNNLEIERSTLAAEIEKLKEELITEKKSLKLLLDKSLQSQTTQTDKNDNILTEKICKCDELKGDNKRLCSDIDGLQIYLSKISKENSDLNDKLREIIATSDNLPDKSDNFINDMDILKTEIRVGKDKIDDLLRENSLLIEENLELKDQIQSQLNTEPSKVMKSIQLTSNTPIINMNEKYDKLLQRKQDLESRITELEQMNNSLNKNVDHNQEKCEKLKTSNEKLQRKLDEALVSLRHLHSLEENTELEYLRNILYEYLTGAGTHSLTLAKVLSAVVKFDNKQTEQVLQKEKERQGLLRQLGLL
ncbi:unnamed protein product [Leptidea sinapis]|uniref:GRIP domain-containing protein n=1 Tax=Leptidea sinapis TaxID=189913 RepID=A0A5E4Q7G3_9NEOP|nr:unnamed protein product [Leptidea sinapis]